MITAIARNVSTVRRGNGQGTFTRTEADPLFRPFEPEEPSDLEDPPAWPGNERWEVFLPDDDEPYEALPQPGDFWIDADGEFGE